MKIVAEEHCCKYIENVQICYDANLFSTPFSEFLGERKEKKRTSSGKIDDSVKMVMGAPFEDLKDQVRGRLSRRISMWSLRANTNLTAHNQSNKVHDLKGMSSILDLTAAKESCHNKTVSFHSVTRLFMNEINLNICHSNLPSFCIEIISKSDEFSLSFLKLLLQ